MLRELCNLLNGQHRHRQQELPPLPARPLPLPLPLPLQFEQDDLALYIAASNMRAHQQPTRMPQQVPRIRAQTARRQSRELHVQQQETHRQQQLPENDLVPLLARPPQYLEPDRHSDDSADGFDDMDMRPMPHPRHQQLYVDMLSDSDETDAGGLDGDVDSTGEEEWPRRRCAHTLSFAPENYRYTQPIIWLALETLEKKYHKRMRQLCKFARSEVATQTDDVDDESEEDFDTTKEIDVDKELQKLLHDFVHKFNFFEQIPDDLFFKLYKDDSDAIESLTNPANFVAQFLYDHLTLSIFKNGNQPQYASSSYN